MCVGAILVVCERGSSCVLPTFYRSAAGLFLISVLLYTTFDSLRQALLLYTGIPFAVVGGIFALFLRGMPFSISAAVGFIALFNVAVLNGVVMVATVVIGGLITPTLLTLLILPTLYSRFELESVGSAD